MNYAKEAYRMAEQLEARLDARTAGGAAFTAEAPSHTPTGRTLFPPPKQA